MAKSKFKGYDLDQIRKMPKRKVEINGLIDSRSYLELALEATKEYNEAFPNKKFDLKIEE